jgi:Domain of unknown function (DUF4398)
MIRIPLTMTRASGSLPLLAAIALLGAACASTPPAPPPALQDAQQAITAAERIDASHFAPGDMAEARSKLVTANSAVTDGNLVSAAQLALQARAAAELASAKTASAKALAENTAIRTGNAALREELNRNSGDAR